MFSSFSATLLLANVLLNVSVGMQKRNGGLIDSECAPSYMRRLNEKGPLDPQLENTMKKVDSNDRPSFEFSC